MKQLRWLLPLLLISVRYVQRHDLLRFHTPNLYDEPVCCYECCLYQQDLLASFLTLYHLCLYCWHLSFGAKSQSRQDHQCHCAGTVSCLDTQLLLGNGRTDTTHVESNAHEATAHNSHLMRYRGQAVAKEVARPRPWEECHGVKAGISVRTGTPETGSQSSSCTTVAWVRYAHYPWHYFRQRRWLAPVVFCVLGQDE